METGDQNQISQIDYQELNKNASSRYMEDTRKHYLLASNTESLQSLMDNQKEELTNVLIELKSEYDLITRESSIKKQLIEEYNKKIIMLQKANINNKKKQEEKKETTRNLKEGIDIKKNKKNEEMYNKKTLEKQLDKLSKDLIIIQKQIYHCENESALLDKKKEKTKLEENAINEKKNQIQYKIDEQTSRIRKNRSENDLQIQYYETVIRQKVLFMQLADDRKERQKKIEQDAKNDSLDKQEVEKRKKLLLLMLYNQYLKQRMDNQLKKYEELEYTFQKIRDIVGTQDLSLIINFVLERNKRYNYNLHIVEEKQRKIDKITKDIKRMKSQLVNIKNEVLVNEKSSMDSNLKTETSMSEYNGLNKKEINMIKIENEKNQQLRLLGQKYNEVNLAYNQVLTNIKEMQEYDNNNPLDLGEEEKEENEGIKKDEKRKIKLSNEENEIVEGYENLLNKILKAFNILYLCKSKQEFINLMREKGISQKQNFEENKINVNSMNKRSKGKKRSRRGSINIKSTLKKISDEKEIKKNNEGDEEEDSGNYDPDKIILNKFIKEQKKEVDDFIKIKKVEIKKPPAEQ